MDIVHLMDFSALVRYGAFSRAAAARNVTQPAFSRRIKALEEWVGTPLFTRTNRGCSLTLAGERFHQDVDDLILRFLDLRDAALSASQEEVHILNIAATQTLAFVFFPAWIAKAGESTDIGLVQLNSGNLVICSRLLIDDQVQLLLCHIKDTSLAPFPADSFKSALIGHDALVLVSGIDETGNPYFKHEQSDTLPLLNYTTDSGIGRILEAHLRTSSKAAHFVSVFSSHLAASLLPLVKTGHGVAWLPLSLINYELEAGRLCRLLPLAEDIDLEVRLFRTAQPLTGVARNVWEYAANFDAGN